MPLQKNTPLWTNTFFSYLSKIIFSFVILSFLGVVSTYAHERWVPHTILQPVEKQVFSSFSWDMLSIVGRTILLLGIIILTWIFRFRLEKILLTLGKKLGIASFAKNLSDFCLDRPFQKAWFIDAGKQIQKLVLKVPAIVLMYAAANKSIVMLSFPIDPALTFFFQMAQVCLALLIITDTALPIVGYTIFGLFIYFIYYYHPIVAVDALPVLAVASIYITMPLLVTNQRRLTIRQNQILLMRIIVGFSFFMLGVMKIMNHNLTIGVIDNQPLMMHDPMLKLFSYGTDPAYAREWFVFGFGMSEMMIGLLLMLGFFARVMSLITAFVFGKLMLSTFGWQEIAHLYPISVLLLVAFSKIYDPALHTIRRRAEDVSLAASLNPLKTPQKQADPSQIKSSSM